MPSLTDDTNERLLNATTQKAEEVVADVIAESAYTQYNRSRDNDFHAFNDATGEYEFKQYFDPEERRETFENVVQSFNDVRKDYTEHAINEEDLYKRYNYMEQAAKKKVKKIEQKQEKNWELLEETTQTKTAQITTLPQKKRLVYEKRKTKILENGSKKKEHGRLKFVSSGRMTEREYYKRLHQNDVEMRKARRLADKSTDRMKRVFSDENIGEDEDEAAVSRKIKRGARAAKGNIRMNARVIRSQTNPYARLKFSQTKADAEKARNYQYERRKNLEYDRAMMHSADSAKMKRKLKKEIVMRQQEVQGSFVARIKHQMFIKKKVSAYRRLSFKRKVAMFTSIGSILLTVMIVLMIGVLILFCFISGGTETLAQAVTNNTYYDISDATAYFRQLETDLEEFLNPETLEPMIREENQDKEIYEFIYDLDDFGFSANTLIAYLSVKFQEFNLEEVEGEIQSIFDEMYYFHYEFALEPRYILIGSHYDPAEDEWLEDYEWRDVWICYVYLEKTEMEDVVERRMTDEEKKYYESYKLSTGGQQVYGGIMEQDWSGLISSQFGQRIHPVTGERTFHNGVDIAVPVGTMLYSAVRGKVTTAAYSDTAGNYVIVTTDDGWSVKFMHMDSFVVTVGQKIDKGDFVGYSGNTGRSTGPHLHLEVRDPENIPINPIFIIPQAVGKQVN